MADWNAEAYHRVSEPQLRWGLEVLPRLPLRGDETVLDAGCGSGRLTAKLAERLPRGHVLALDVSPSMLERARRELASFGERVTVQQADLAKLELVDAADAVFSNATFHWVNDHDSLFAGLFRALRPGGRLVAQCGGGENLVRLRGRALSVLRARWPEAASRWTEPWFYSDAERARAQLQRAGFTDIRTGLVDAPTPFATPAAYREFCGMVVLRHHLELLPDGAARDDFLDAMTQLAGADGPALTIDYVRLNIDARKP
ncbi:MAG: class I SAM-dependent methyltransferase [Deltaproteobacteria bacterium]|nr:class I SAM-dependent methyltransferase [Deltaproteobacteria bacterium]